MSKYAFVMQSGGNINETSAEQMDLVIVKLEIVPKNILYIPNHVLYAILQQLMSIIWVNYYIIAPGFGVPSYWWTKVSTKIK